MQNQTLYLPGFHLETLRHKPRLARQRLADKIARIKANALHNSGGRFSRAIAGHLLGQETSGNFSRRRLFSRENTFWAFFSQVLDTDSGCREVVGKIQAYAIAKDCPLPSSSTAA